MVQSSSCGVWSVSTQSRRPVSTLSQLITGDTTTEVSCHVQDRSCEWHQRVVRYGMAYLWHFAAAMQYYGRTKQEHAAASCYSVEFLLQVFYGQYCWMQVARPWRQPQIKLGLKSCLGSHSNRYMLQAFAHFAVPGVRFFLVSIVAYGALRWRHVRWQLVEEGWCKRLISDPPAHVVQMRVIVWPGDQQ